MDIIKNLDTSRTVVGHYVKRVPNTGIELGPFSVFVKLSRTFV